MAVSKRLRYEILRRDNHACTYCGATAPDVRLTVDHVLPTALGGTDEPTNLTTACADCNGGKSASSPDAPIVESVSQDALRWARAKAQAAEMAREQAEDMLVQSRGLLDYWVNAFLADYGTPAPRPNGDRQTVEAWLARGLPATIIMDHIDRVVVRDDLAWQARWPYFAGCCWNSLRAIEDRAAHLIETGAV